MTEEERQKRLERLRECIRLGEDEYDQIYEPRTHNSPAGHYSDAKDFFCEAIALANELGLTDQAKQLSERLDHIKAVFRSQFAGVDSYAMAAPASASAPGGESAPDPFAEVVEGIRGNAAFVVSALRPVADFEFNLDSGSVKWLDGYIEQIRTQPRSEDEREQMFSNLGSYLGEAIIAAYGGAWAQDEYGWHIRFDEKNRVYPFNKVAKQFANGPEDSVFSLYSSIGALRMGR